MKPADRRRQVKIVGEDLVRNYGRKQFYSVDEVKASNGRQSVVPDFGCWSHATLNCHRDFDAYHQAMGESCDYASMKAEMLSSVSLATDTSWFDFDLSWLEFPDIDWSIFDTLDLS